MNKKNQHLWSHKYAYAHWGVFYYLWGDNSERFSWCANSDGNFAVFIIRNFLQISVFTKYFSRLIFHIYSSLLVLMQTKHFWQTLLSFSSINSYRAESLGTSALLIVVMSCKSWRSKRKKLIIDSVIIIPIVRKVKWTFLMTIFGTTQHHTGNKRAATGITIALCDDSQDYCVCVRVVLRLMW